MFDLPNSQSPYGKGYKSPLRLNSKAVWLNIINEMKDFLCRLKLTDGTPLLDRCGVQGLYIDLHSVADIAEELLDSGKARQVSLFRIISFFIVTKMAPLLENVEGFENFE